MEFYVVTRKALKCFGNHLGKPTIAERLIETDSWNQSNTDEIF